MSHSLLDNADKIERFTLYGIVTYGKVVSVYDGDTFDMSFIIPMSALSCERPISKRKKGTCIVCEENYESSILMRMKCRMENINAPELDTSEGKEAKTTLENIIIHKVFQCRLGGFDKYGRLLITLLDEDENLKKHMEQHIMNYN